METMYDRIKRMSKDEMRNFIYWVYLCGNEDGKIGLRDSDAGYFGGKILNDSVIVDMPNDSIDDLWEWFDETYA